MNGSGAIPPNRLPIGSPDAPRWDCKLLIIISSYPTGDHVAGLFLPDLIRELNRLGCQVHVLTQNCQANARETKTVWPGHDLTLFGWSGGYTRLVSVLERGLTGYLLAMQYFIKGTLAGWRVALAWKPDFILSEWVVPGGIIAWGVSRLTGVPYAARALGSDVLGASRSAKIRSGVRFVARRAAVLFADGFDLCEKTSALADGKPCHFAATSRELGAERSDYRPLDDSGRFTTLTVGRLHPSKGQDVLIRACARLKARGVALRAYLVGSGEQMEAWRALARELGVTDEVILTGRLEDGDIAELLRHVDCVVIPSRSESIPLVLREAAAAGRPLIVSDVGDMGMLVRKYELGIAVPPDDPEALAAALAHQAKTPVRVHSEKAGELLELLSSAKAARTILSEFMRHRQGTLVSSTPPGGQTVA